MSLKEKTLAFVDKYKGKYVEAGGSIGAENQCVDLANQFISEVLHLDKILWTNAVDFPTKANKNDWEYIENTPTGVPQTGDLVVWNFKPYGHIGIFIEGNATSFTSFDQNWDENLSCQIEGHTYYKVIGWLRAKNPPTESDNMSDTIPVNKKDFENLVNKATKYDAFVNAGFSDVNQVLTKIQECEQSCKAKDNELKELQKQIADLNDALNKASEQNASLDDFYESKIKTLEDRIKKAESEPNGNFYLKKVEELEVKNAELMERILELEKPSDISVGVKPKVTLFTVIKDWLDQFIKQ